MQYPPTYECLWKYFQHCLYCRCRTIFNCQLFNKIRFLCHFIATSRLTQGYKPQLFLELNKEINKEIMKYLNIDHQSNHSAQVTSQVLCLLQLCCPTLDFQSCWGGAGLVGSFYPSSDCENVKRLFGTIKWARWQPPVLHPHMSAILVFIENFSFLSLSRVWYFCQIADKYKSLCRPWHVKCYTFILN